MLNGMFWVMLMQYGENSDRKNLSQIGGGVVSFNSEIIRREFYHS